MNEEVRHLEDAMSWCIKNKIVVYPIPISNTELKLDIDFKGKIIHGEKIYQSKGSKKVGEDWSNKIREIYQYYYDNREPLTSTTEKDNL